MKSMAKLKLKGSDHATFLKEKSNPFTKTKIGRQIFKQRLETGNCDGDRVMSGGFSSKGLKHQLSFYLGKFGHYKMGQCNSKDIDWLIHSLSRYGIIC
ncbi:hypothetical protein LOK49_LG04G02044 [Camellia lanceoleosa]|uniref:Uncharacterized protein n=1 Tax=Camellia lanceoleosa TaxID=1840588 RepID=A0ACC0HWU0_9ERIC|nr:hypothetical protein LOK49_LG04G02044 [Camellia lanceoleosa]